MGNAGFRPAGTAALVLGAVLAAFGLSPPSSAGDRAALAGPTTSVLDNFDGRGAEDPLDQWGNWAASSIDGQGQTLELIGGGAGHNEGSAGDSYRTQPIAGDAEVYATMPAVPPNNAPIYLYLHLRDLGAAEWDGYQLRLERWVSSVADTIQIQRITDGQPLVLASRGVPGDLQNGDGFMLRQSGGTLTAWHRRSGVWTQLLSAPGSEYQSGQLGLGSDPGGTRWDDFGGTGATTPEPAPPALPSTPIPLDRFDRPDEDPLVQSGAWATTPITGAGQTLEVLSGRAGHNEGDFVHGDSYRPSDVTGDAEAYATLADVPENNDPMFLYLHVQDVGSAAWDGYVMNLERTITGGAARIQKVTDGSATDLVAAGTGIAEGDVFLLRRVGGSLTLWRQNAGTWTKLMSTSDPAYNNGFLGLGVADHSSRWDDFGGGALEASPPPPPPPPSSGPPPEQSHGICGGGGIHGDSTSRCLSDPVNTLTGAFVTSVEDIAFPNTGVPFAWSRTYTSSATSSGRLGPGWTDGYATSLEIETSGDIRLHGDEGQIIEYTKQADGSFDGAPGARSTLRAVAEGYELVRKDHAVYRFGEAGRLLSISDRNGQGVTLEYDGAGRLTTVAGEAQRAIVSYNEADLVTRVSHAGRSVAYGYAAGRLTTVTDLRGNVWTYSYDPDGRLATIVDPLDHVQVTNVYGPSGRVISQTDALGKTTTFDWNATTQTATATDPRGNAWVDDYDDNVLVERSDPLGNGTGLDHDDDLNAAAVTSPSGERTSMTYDSRGNLLTTTAPASLAGVRKTFVYNANNDPTRVTDARGVVTAYAYDIAGNVETVLQDGRQIAAYTYDVSGRVLGETDANGETTTFTYDAHGSVASETDPLGNRTSYTYDEAGRMLTRVDPRGNVPGGTPTEFMWRWTYDSAGNVTSERDPLGAVTTHTYDPAGNELSVTDPKGRTTTFAYDAANRLVSETGPDPDGSGPLPAPVTSFAYDDAGNRRAQTDVLGRTTTFGYDAANRLVSTTFPDPDGAGPLPAPVTTNAYDDDGNLASTVEPRGNLPGATPAEYRTSFAHDAAGRLLTTTDPVGNATTNAYDAVGNLVSVRDANGHTTTSTYDAAGRVASVTAPDGGATTYARDGEGNVRTRTDANGNITTHEYDATGRLTTETGPDPDGPGPEGPAVTTHTYDPNGNLASTVDANGNATTTAGDGRTTLEYDAANRLLRIDYSDSTPDVTFGYDPAGNRTSMTDGAGTETRAYDALDRLTSATRGPDTFSYGYDAAGNLAKRTYPGGATTVYVHDTLDRLTSAEIGERMTTYAYDAASNLVETRLPSENGYVESRAYDRAGRLTSVATRRGPTVLSSFLRTLDAVGNPTQIERTGSLQQTQTFSYDPNDRIVSVCFEPGGCSSPRDPFVRWTYDRVGNRLSEERGGDGTTTYAYDAADRLTRAGETTYTYDDNGNQLSAGARTFSYDLANRMRTTRRGSTTTRYSYDGDGVRLQSSTGSSASKTTNYFWDVSHALPQLAVERNGSGSTVREYAYGANRISMTSGSATSYFHYDTIGSVVNVTSSSGMPRWTWSYEPFGVTRTEQRSGRNAPTIFVRFAGEYLDPTDLYHLRARQYDPMTGRFLRPDPVDSPAGSPPTSAYAYAANRPTVMDDPSGETFGPIDEWREFTTSATSLEPWPPYVPTRPRRPRHRLVHPIPLGYSASHGPIHATGGIEHYRALDFFPGAGAPVLAVQSGIVYRFSGHDPRRGEVRFGIYGWSLYLKADSGSDYFYTHLGSRTVGLGRVRIGQVIGRVGRWIRPSGENKSHLHLGVYGGPITIQMVSRARRVRAG